VNSLEIRRGDLWWIDLGTTQTSEPAFKRPVLIIQADYINRIPIETTIVASLTSNLELENLSGNLLLERTETGLRRDSVVNLTQLKTVNKDALLERVGPLSSMARFSVDRELARVLDLPSPSSLNPP